MLYVYVVKQRVILQLYTVEYSLPSSIQLYSITRENISSFHAYARKNNRWIVDPVEFYFAQSAQYGFDNGVLDML